MTKIIIMLLCVVFLTCSKVDNKKSYGDFIRSKPMLAKHLDGIQNEHLRHFIWRASKETGLPNRLIDAVITIESNGRLVYSPTKVWGPMQVTKAVAKSYDLDRYNVRENILSGALYLKDLLELFEDTTYALAAYNLGPGHVANFGPTKASGYVKKIKAEWEKI